MGGRTWHTKYNDLPLSYRYSSLVQFIDPTTVYLLKQDGSIYKSKDNSTTGSVTGLNSTSTNFGFFDENNGWAHIGITQWRIVNTRNGGNNWKPLATPSLSINGVWLDNTSTVTIASDGSLISQFVEGRAGW
jgi:hypothetical protein